MIERFIGLLAPHTCISCGNEGDIVCAWCRYDAIDNVPSRCYRCSSVTVDSAVCASCRKLCPLGHVWVRSVYADVARRLVYVLKFERAKAAARSIADLLDETLPYLPPETVITHVPTASKRIRIRGYDQTYLIAKQLANQRGLSYRSLLVRHGHSRQVGATKSLRAEQAAKSYTAKQTNLGLREVLVVDDILTTGATIETVAKILKQAGVKHVNAAVFAQKQ